MVSNLPQFNRRCFLQVSAAAASRGLPAACNAAAVENRPLIDTHVYVGRWPLRRLSGDMPSELVVLLRRANITKAWAGSFDGLFHKDIHGVNSRLVETCRKVGDGMLSPIGTVNPTLPDWEEDVRRAHETFKMRGIRLHPAYHGYTLDDPRFARLLQLATAHSLFVQLVAQMTNERPRLLAPRVAQVDLAPLANIVRPMRGLHLLLSNGRKSLANLGQSARNSSNIYFDTACAADSHRLRSLFDAVSVDHVVCGSGAPLFDPAASTKAIQKAKLTAMDAARVRGGNAKRLMSNAD